MRGKSPVSLKSICAFVAAFALAATFGAWWLLNGAADEPYHGGHPLSYWLQQHEPAADAGSYIPIRLSAESAVAVREIGTNAFPTMFQWITRPEKGLKSKIVSWANDDRIPFFARRLLIPAYPKSYRPDLAILAFRALDTNGGGAVPSLAQMLHSPCNGRWAVMALCAVGPEGVTALEEAFPSIHDGILRANIISQFEQGITPDLEQQCVAFLAETLGDDSQAAVRMSAARVLGTFTNSPAVAVPALTKALQDRDGGVRFTASASLGHFGSAATSAIGALQATLKDANPQVRLDAARALRSVQGREGTRDEKP